MTKVINVQWVNKDTDEIIFQDIMTVKNFKKIHGVSPHTDSSGKRYHDVVIKIEEEMISGR